MPQMLPVFLFYRCSGQRSRPTAHVFLEEYSVSDANLGKTATERYKVVLCRDCDEDEIRVFAADEITASSHGSVASLNGLMGKRHVFANHDVHVLNLQHDERS